LLVELPDVLPLPIEPELEPVLGVVGLAGLVVLGDVPPLELELEPLLKCASHSAREIWPSLLVSTDEKLGWEDAPPLADGEALDGLLDDEDEESAAAAARDRAKSAAAVVTVTVLIMDSPLWVGDAHYPSQAPCRYKLGP
jgi:hypothetical protein